MIRRIFIGVLVALTTFIALPALAHGPTPKQVSQTVRVNALPDQVWSLLRDPARLAEWHSDVASSSLEGSGRGATREVKFSSGGSVLDGIDDIDNEAMSIRWRLRKENIEVFPASSYTHTITLTAAEDGTDVSWRAVFFRADTTNEPEERFNDEAAVAAMEAFVGNGLAGLEKLIDADRN